MAIIICGGLRIDYLISADGRARLNQIGGNAVYAAVGACMYTREAFLLARAGENYPQAWLDELRSKGILPAYVRRVPGWQEMRTFYAYVDEKTRVDHNPEIHFARIGQPLPEELEGYSYSTIDTQNPDSALALRGHDVPQRKISGAAVHLAPTALRSQHELVHEFRRRKVGQITVDPGEYRLMPHNASIVRATCALTDAFLPSELEVGLLLDTADAYEAAEIFASWGPSLVVIKRGPDGCLLYERDRRRFTTVPAYPAQVVDVTGAGDVFSGAFAAALWQTGDALRSTLMGAVAASFAVEGYGALYALDQPQAAIQQRIEDLSTMLRFD